MLQLIEMARAAEMSTVIASTPAGNPAAGRVMQRAGLQPGSDRWPRRRRAGGGHRALAAGRDCRLLPDGDGLTVSAGQAKCRSLWRVRFSSAKYGNEAKATAPSQMRPASSPLGIRVSTGPKNACPSMAIVGVPTS